jgi:hypothetical protein
MWWVLASSGPLDGVAHSMGDYVSALYICSIVLSNLLV